MVQKVVNLNIQTITCKFATLTKYVNSRQHFMYSYIVS